MNIQNKPNLISFSGGRTSAMMTRILTFNGIPENTYIVFVNTGKEKEETLEFVDECSKRWKLPIVWIESVINFEKGKGVDFKIVDFKKASRNGEPFESLITKFGCPNRVTRFCTGDLKIKPMQKFMQSLGFNRWTVQIGIRADETNRIRKVLGGPYDINYPLYDFGITISQVNDFWADNKQGFDLRLKKYEGNCDLCHLKSLTKKRQIIRDNPKVADWWIAQEKRTKSQFDATITVERLKRDTLSMPLLFDPIIESMEISCFCGD